MRPPTHPTSVPVAKLLRVNFPLPLLQLVRDYWDASPHAAQDQLLRSLPFYPNADCRGTSASVVTTALGLGHKINEFCITPKGTPRFHLVLVHGYGAGLGFFIRNFPALVRQGWLVHAVDLLGYGCSSRPEFANPLRSAQGAEEWFHSLFAEWLECRRLNAPEQIMVVAHLMGAHLMATLAIKRHFCRKLVMVSPGAVLKHRTPVPVPEYFAKLWNRNISPFSLVRWTGPWGSKLVSMWLARRFAGLKEAPLLHRYAYAIFRAPGLGEYMLNYLLAPGADPRLPLLERGVHRIRLELVWMYGSHDWMDRLGGDLCLAIVNGLGTTRSTVHIVPKLGHHLYLDNPEAFNRMVLDEMERFELD